MTFKSVAVCAAVFIFGAGCSRVIPSARLLESGKAYQAAHDPAHALVMFRRAVLADPSNYQAHYETGLTYMSLGDFPSAFTQLSAAVQLNPGFAPARLKLAELYAATQHPRFLEEANRIARSLLARSGQDPAILNILAVTELELGQRKDAILHLREAISNSPAEARSYLNLAGVRLAEENASGALEVLAEGAAAAPKSSAIAVAHARLLRLGMQFEAAEAEARRAASISWQSPDALQMLAEILSDRGRKNEAGDLYRRVSSSGDARYRLAYSGFLIQNGHLQEGISALSALLETNPADREARGELLAAYRTANDSASIEAVVAAALKANPKDLDALLERARLRLDRKSYNEAIDDLNGVISLRPDSSLAHVLLAYCEAANRRPELQRQELAAALRLDSSLLGARLQLADSFIASRNPAGALASLDEAPAAQRLTLPLILYRNAALLDAGDLVQLNRLLPRQLASFRNPALMLQLGSLRIREKNFAAARTAAMDALRAGADSARAYELLLAAYHAEGRLAEGIALLPESRDARLQMVAGCWMLQAGLLDAARGAFMQSAKDSGQEIAAKAELAKVELRSGDIAKAVRLAEDVLTKDSANTGALLVSAAARASSGDRDGAAGAYAKVLESSPDNLEALNNLAWILSGDVRRLDQALGYARRAFQIQPANPTVNDTLGWILQLKGLSRSAVRFLETAVSSSGAARHRYHLAIAYASLGDRGRGWQVYKAARRSDPGLPEERLARDLLDRKVLSQ